MKLIVCNKMEIKLEDIVFWFLILSIIALAIWMLSGSPTEMNAIIALAIFVAGSQIVVWKTIFKAESKNSINLERMDKKTAISFERMKNHMNNKFLEVNNQLNEIKSLIKK